MKISYKWLQDFIGTAHTAVEVSNLLTGCGLEVEDISNYHSIPGGLEGIVIGEVLTAVPHPNADKLRVCTVALGQAEPKQIVCGAPNVAAGQKVLVATVGATVHPTKGEPFEIKKAKIRGEISEGMICAEDELSLGESHDGILVLPAHYEIGKPASAYFEVYADEILEIGLTANRGDAASHYGVARDLKALGLNLHLPAKPTLNYIDSQPVTVELQPESGCLRYSGVLISGIKVSASPTWLQNRLKAIGLSPINNIVDATNYILHTWGQPLHAFDASKIVGGKIIVRKAKVGEKITTLDKVTRELKGLECLISDTQKPLALAGVFGGLDSGITAETEQIFIESAWFDSVVIRKSAKTHGLHTDASFRFERGTDPNITVEALQRVTELILEIAGGQVASALMDVYPNPVKAKEIVFDPAKSNALIGKEISETLVKKILNALEIEVGSNSPTTWLLKVPPYRVDVDRPADITEEILRIYGLNQIEMGHEIKSAMTFSSAAAGRQIKERLCQWLSAQGLLEMASNSLTKSSYYTEEELQGAVTLLNPLSQDLETLRLDFCHAILEAIQYNNNRKNQDLRFFEVGKTYHRNGELNNLGSYTERKHLVLALYGRKQPESWNSPKQDLSYFGLKGLLERLLKQIGINEVQYGFEADKRFDQATQLVFRKQVLGTFGMLYSKLAKGFDIDKPLWYADLDLDAIIEIASRKSFKLKPVSVFPSVRRDLALELDEAITYLQLEKIALKTAPKLLKQINVFDVYTGEKIAAGKKSYALSFMLQDEQKTLTDEEIDATMQQLIAQFTKETGAILRG